MPLWPFTFIRGGSIHSSSSLELCSVQAWKQLSGLDRLRGWKGAVLCLIISHWDFLFFSFPCCQFCVYSVVYFASLCTVMTRWTHFCCLFFSQVDSLWKSGNDLTQGAREANVAGCYGVLGGHQGVVRWLIGCVGVTPLLISVTLALYEKKTAFLHGGPLKGHAPPADLVLGLAGARDPTTDEVTWVFVRPRIQLSTLIRSTGCTHVTLSSAAGNQPR